MSYPIDVKLQWQKSGEPDLAGYKIYYDTNPGAPYSPAVEDRATNYPDAPPIIMDSDVTEITLQGLTDTKIYYFALTAFRAGEPDSDYSAERSTFEIILPSPGFYANSSNYDSYSVKGVAITKPDDIIVRAGVTSIGGPFSTNANGEWSGLCNFASLGQGQLSLTSQSETDGFTSLGVPGTYDIIPPSSEAFSPTQNNERILVDWVANDAAPGSGLKKTVLWYKRGSGGNWSPGPTTTVTGDTFQFYPGEGDGTYYFATQSLDKAGNWEDGPKGDGDTSVYYTAPSGSPGTWPDGYTGLEGGGGGCFIATAASD